jgi:hypothetical protein
MASANIQGVTITLTGSGLAVSGGTTANGANITQLPKFWVENRDTTSQTDTTEKPRPANVTRADNFVFEVLGQSMNGLKAAIRQDVTVVISVPSGLGDAAFSCSGSGYVASVQDLQGSETEDIRTRIEIKVKP